MFAMLNVHQHHYAGLQYLHDDNYFVVALYRDLHIPCHGAMVQNNTSEGRAVNLLCVPWPEHPSRIGTPCMGPRWDCNGHVSAIERLSSNERAKTRVQISCKHGLVWSRASAIWLRIVQPLPHVPQQPQQLQPELRLLPQLLPPMQQQEHMAPTASCVMSLQPLDLLHSFLMQQDSRRHEGTAAAGVVIPRSRLAFSQLLY
jgi:hypothetical protein